MGLLKGVIIERIQSLFRGLTKGGIKKGLLKRLQKEAYQGG